MARVNDYTDPPPDFESATATKISGRQDDVIIGVMGSTGTGKSSFIRLMSGDTSVKVGDSLESETSDIQVIRFVHPNGRNIVIVDTPGFGDSRVGDGFSDTDILKKVTAFLLDQYDKNRKLNGLLYLQRISDSRFCAQSDKNLRMFKGLCGAESFKNVVVVTTFWDYLADEEQGERRETQLKSRFFKPLVDGGAHFMRHRHDTTKTAMDVLNHIFTLLPTNVQIQEEIRVKGKTLEETAAGSVHRDEVERLIAKHKEEMASLIEGMKTAHQADKQSMEDDIKSLRQQLARSKEERMELKNGLEKLKAAQKEVDEKKRSAQQEEEQSRRERERLMQLGFQAFQLLHFGLRLYAASLA